MNTGFLLQVMFPVRIGGFPAAATAVAFAIGLALGVGSGAFESSFYEAVAQIIPVLLLVLAVEARFFRIDMMSFKELRTSFEVEMREALGSSPSTADVVRAAFALQSGQSLAYVQQRLLRVLALGTLVAGEVISILILGRPGLESSGLQGLVLGATFAGLGAVTVAALTGPMPVAGESSQGAAPAGGDKVASSSDE